MRSKQLWGIEFSNDPVNKGRIADLFEKKIRENINKDWATEQQFDVDANHYLEENLLWLNDLLSEQDLRHYAISETVINICQKVKIPEPLNFKWMRNIPDSKKQYNFGRSLIRFHKEDSRIRIFASTAMEGWKGDVRYSPFMITLDDEEAIISEHEYAQASLRLFYQLSAFVELSEVQEFVIAPGGKHGKNNSTPNNLKNDEQFPITVVTSTWDKTIFVKGKIPVSGHFRMQWKGTGRSIPELIYVHPYTKDGYTVRAGKLISEGVQKD